MATIAREEGCSITTGLGDTGRTGESARLLARFYRWLWRISPGLVLGLIAVSAVPQVVIPVQLIGVQLLVDAIIAQADWLGWLLIVVLTLVAQQLVLPLSFCIQGTLSDRIESARSQQLLEALCSWPGIARFEDSANRDEVANATRMQGRFGFNAVLSLTTMGTAVTAAAAATAVLGSFVWWFPIVVAASVIPALATTGGFEKTFASLIYTLTPESRRLHYLRDLHLAYQPAKDIRLAGAFTGLRQRYASIFDASEDQLRARERRGVAQRVVAECLGAMVLVAALLALLLGWAPQHVSAGELTAIVAGVLAIRTQLEIFAQYFIRMPSWLSVVRSLDQVTATGPDLPVVGDGHGSRGSQDGPAAVEFERIVFSYPGAQTPTIDGLSLRVNAGETVALVGHNGSGKTTLIKLLLRLYDVDAGRITVDGIDIREWEIDALRSRVGALFQDFVQFDLTAGLNIGLGDIDHVGDVDRIAQAASQGNATAVIADLPDGLESRVGNLLGGRQLSGGQWQRLALSRAAMSRAGLMVLDEPTAHLDPRAEAEVFERFAHLGSDRTIILVSHRYSTVALADRIVLLDHGAIRESGPHHELMRADGEYARQFRLQAGQYLDDPTAAEGRS